MSILDHILVSKKKDDGEHLMIDLPGQTLRCDRVDFTTGSLVFVKCDAKFTTKNHRTIHQKDLDTRGVNCSGFLELLALTRPLADVLLGVRRLCVKGLPITLTGDNWYLSTKPWKELFLTNGTHFIETRSGSVKIVPSRTRRRPVRVDPIGLDDSGWPLFPLRQAVDLLIKQDAVLADPYAWRKQGLPRQGSRNILVVGPKT